MGAAFCKVSFSSFLILRLLVPMQKFGYQQKEYYSRDINYRDVSFALVLEGRFLNLSTIPTPFKNCCLLPRGMVCAASSFTKVSPDIRVVVVVVVVVERKPATGRPTGKQHTTSFILPYIQYKYFPQVRILFSNPFTSFITVV